MSIQHRSRIKSVADYTSTINSEGACCYARDELSPRLEFYNTCVAGGGHWQPIDIPEDIDQISCPDLGATGCCCACSYVDNFEGATGFFDAYAPSSGNCQMANSLPSTLEYPCYQGGLRDNITFCECSDKGGVWAKGVSCGAYTEEIPAEGNVPEYYPVGAHQLCTRASTVDDVRWPGACCSGNTCDDACSPKECATIGNAHGATGVQYWGLNYCRRPDTIDDSWPGSGDNDIVLRCDDSAHSSADWNPNIFSVDSRTNILVATGKFGKAQKLLESSAESTSILKSSCSYLQKTNSSSKELECSLETKDVCDGRKGIWSGYNEDGQQIDCSLNVTTNIQHYMTNQKKMPASVVDIWNIGDRVLNQGRFVGIFNCKDSTHGIGSECFGSESTGTCYPYHAQNNDNTKNSNKTYAIILEDRDFGGRKLSYESNSGVSNIKKSSVWDSHYNASYNNTTLMKNINKLYNKNIWWNRIIPSQDMLAFIFNQTNKIEFILKTTIEDKTKIYPFTPMIQDNSVFYWTSTFPSIGYNKKQTQLAVIQSFGDNPIVAYSPRTMKHMVRVIEAIEIIT